MKKSLSFLLYLSMACLVLTAVLNFTSFVFDDFNLFPITNEVVENFNEMEDNPSSGWYLILAGGGALLADFTIGIALVFILVFIPIMMNLLIIVFQIIARLFQIGAEKKWKNIVSKVFTVFSIIVQVQLCILLFFAVISEIQISKILLFISLAINITSVFFYSREFRKMNQKNIIENTTNNILAQ